MGQHVFCNHSVSNEASLLCLLKHLFESSKTIHKHQPFCLGPQCLNKFFTIICKADPVQPTPIKQSVENLNDSTKKKKKHGNVTDKRLPIYQIVLKDNEPSTGHSRYLTHMN